MPDSQFTSSPGRRSRPAWPLVLFGLLLALIGLALAVGGVRLAMLGGSWYYLITGVLLVASGLCFAMRRMAGFWLFAAVFVGTFVWALAEVGLAFWPLVPRLAPVLVLGVLALLALPRLSNGRLRGTARGGAALLVLMLVAGGAAMFQPHGVIEAPAAAVSTTPAAAPAAQAVGESRWQYYGRTPDGTRFAPYAQINAGNVDQLETAWTFRTGEIAGPGSENQNTPLQIGDTVYVCTPRNQVIALDADAGTERWRFDPKADAKVWNRCRGVGYYEPAAVSQPVAEMPAAQPGAACARRIVLTTVDARLIEIDAATGKPCEGFGQGGSVDLKQGMGEVKPSYYFQTSMPTVVRNLVVVGGWVFDGRSVDEPSGVVRAFSADTGELVWAWDAGNPAITKLPPAGETYTRSTPNVWSTPAFDDKLGLIYLPTGNNPPDFWGAQRTGASETHSSSVVAVDIATGRERWHFQTVHHDLWDYDVPSQPMLIDVPDDKGAQVPALIQLTKRGQIFLLDRRDGKPIAGVEERPVTQGGQAGDRTSPTQPYSVGMPAIGNQTLTEASMWGATWFDQLACRIAFRQLRYEGEFTPPTTTSSLIFPGYYGGMNWGSGAADPASGLLIVNDIRMPQQVQLIPRAVADSQQMSLGHGVGLHPQQGTPYAISQQGFNSPLGIPCHAPPWGTLTGIDLKTRQIVWQRPLGTVQDAAVAGLKARAPIPLGMPTLGGPMTTAGGLTFYGGTQDYFLRAFDSRTGRELWKGRMPVGGQATPMTYVSPKSGQQYVLMAAGGARQSADRGDYVIAWKLKAR